ncbi:MAG: hypothetical protein P9C36_15670 [Defluviicoccus sp.]|nr:hypothetical protein [Defluviicoccus sp.]MDG4594058.1 hypothetical protein [Defluviicoccus sp.]
MTSALSSEYWIVRGVLVVLGDLSTISNILSIRGTEYRFVREFSAVMWAICLPVVIFWRRVFILNINANLNNKIDAFLIKYILSRLLNVGFMCPSCELLRVFPDIMAINIYKNVSVQPRKASKVLVFIGQRPEQRRPDVDEYIGKIVGCLGGTGIAVNVVGKCFDRSGCKAKALADESAFFEEVRGSVVVILYEAVAYSRRHSGLVWDVLLNSPFVYLPKTPVLLAQAEGFNNWSAFAGLDEFGDAMWDLKERIGESRALLEGRESGCLRS